MLVFINDLVKLIIMKKTLIQYLHIFLNIHIRTSQNRMELEIQSIGTLRYSDRLVEKRMLELHTYVPKRYIHIY